MRDKLEYFTLTVLAIPYVFIMGGYNISKEYLKSIKKEYSSK